MSRMEMPSATRLFRCCAISPIKVGLTPATGSSSRMSLGSEIGDRVHVMLDEQDGDALRHQALQMLRDLADQGRVDAGDRLVQQDELGLRDRRSCPCDAR